MKEEFLETDNYVKLMEAFLNLDSLPSNARERMGLAYGKFGLGKTVGLERIAAKMDAILLRTNQTWSIKSFLFDLCSELGIETIGNSHTLYKRVIDKLLREKRMLIIDEIDTLFGSKFEVLELIRSIHDESKVMIFFVGMGNVHAKFKRYEHYNSRIMEIVNFTGISTQDVEKYCTRCNVKIEPELLDFFFKRYPNLRQLHALLTRIENYCDINGLESINLATFKLSGVEHAIKEQ